MQIKILFIALLCGFLLVPVSAGAAILKGAECFIDHDPGEGNGIPMEAADGAFDEENEALVCSVNLADLDLKPGFHTVYCRTKNDSGQWGLPRPILNENRMVKPNLVVTGDKHITGAEYFFDSDPGEGNGIACQCADGSWNGAGEEVRCQDIDVSGLSPGIHKLYCRMKDSENLWGPTRSYTVQIYDPAPVLVAAEYFVDDDPGQGQGTSIFFPKDWAWDEPEESVSFEFDASGYSTGNHFLQVRMKDNYGRWGRVSCRPFGEDVCECDLNRDSQCDMQDWLAFGDDWGRTDCNQPGVKCECDINGDGICDMQDWLKFGENWGESGCPTCPEQ